MFTDYESFLLRNAIKREIELLESLTYGNCEIESVISDLRYKDIAILKDIIKRLT